MNHFIEYKYLMHIRMYVSILLLTSHVCTVSPTIQQPIHLNHIQEENEMLNYKSYVNVTASTPCHVCNEFLCNYVIIYVFMIILVITYAGIIIRLCIHN